MRMFRKKADHVIDGLIAEKGVPRDEKGSVVFRHHGFAPELRARTAWRRELAERSVQRARAIESGSVTGKDLLRQVKA